MIIGFQKDGVKYSFDEYVKMSLAGKTKESYGYITTIVNDLKRGHTFPSPTIYGKCPRKVILSQLLDYYVDPAELYFMFLGTCYHYVLEQIDYPGALKEQSVNIQAGKYSLTGRVDLILPDLKQIRDYKTISKIITNYNEKGEEFVETRFLLKPEYVNQINLYAAGLQSEGIEITSGVLEYYAKDSTSDRWTYPVEFKITPQTIINALIGTENYLDKIIPCISDRVLPPKEECKKEFFWMCGKTKKYCDLIKECNEREDCV